MPSQTRKKGQTRSPKKLGDLEWLRDRQEMLARAHSFEHSETTEEDFYKFFEEIGERWSKSKNRKSSQNRKKTKNNSKKKRI